MKKLICLFVILTPLFTAAQKIAETPDGERFIINADGTWTKTDEDVSLYVKPKPVASFYPSKLNNEDVQISHSCYVINFSKKYKLPVWTYCRMRKTEIENCDLDRAGSFKKDPKIIYVQATDKDYAGSKYDKGHLVACEEMSFDETAMEETFYYSNCAPQTTKLNRGQWKNLESLTRNWAVDNDSIEVITGPIFDSNMKTIGKNKIPVPNKFYKIILVYHAPYIKAIAFIMPNSEKALEKPQTYAVTIDEVEKQTGLDFFPEIPDQIEKTMEGKYDLKLWDWTVR